MNRIFSVFFLFFLMAYFTYAAGSLRAQNPFTIQADFQKMCAQYSAFSDLKCLNLPVFLKTQQQLCEIKHATSKCEQFGKEKPTESWRFIKCDLQSLCLQNAGSIKDTAAACITGATSLVTDVVSGLIDAVAKKQAWALACDKSIECKTKLAESQPTTSYLLKPERAKEFAATSASYLLSKKNDYDSIRAEMKSQKGLADGAGYKDFGPSSGQSKMAPKISQGRMITLNSTWEMVKTYLDKELREINCLIPVEKTKLTCQIFADVVSGIAIEKALTKRALLATAKGAAEAGERRVAESFSRIAESSEPKKSFVKSFAQKNVTSTKENEEWVKYISKPSRIQNNLTIENSILKAMNDKIFRDEEYVTALTNAYKEMQFAKLKILEVELKSKNPAFEFHTFSDYKSLRMAYDEIPNVDITSKLKAVVLETNTEFAEFLLKNKLVRDADQPLTWFKASTGKSDDWANLVVRYARDNPSKEMFVDGTNNPKFKEWVQTQFTQGQQLRQNLVESLKDTTMLTSKNPTEANLHRDVFEILRKNRDNSELAKNLIEKKFGLQPMPVTTFENLTEYFKKVDVFSPGLRNTERQFSTLADAQYGGISVDMIGLGADHLQVTSAQSFSRAKNVDELLAYSREAEVKLTENIFRRKAALENVFKEVTGDANAKVLCSGDGCKVYLPNREITKDEAEKFADVLTRNGEQGKLRFSEVAKVQSKELQDVVAKHGEEIEKKLRQDLVGKVDQRKLEGINFSVRITSQKPNEGIASLHISETNGFKLSVSERKLIEQSYQQSLEKVQMGYRLGK